MPAHSFHNPIVDDLVRIAGGDLDLVLLATDAAASGGDEADLLDVVNYIVATRNRARGVANAPR